MIRIEITGETTSEVLRQVSLLALGMANIDKINEQNIAQINAAADAADFVEGDEGDGEGDGTDERVVAAAPGTSGQAPAPQRRRRRTRAEMEAARAAAAAGGPQQAPAQAVQGQQASPATQHPAPQTAAQQASQANGAAPGLAALPSNPDGLRQALGEMVARYKTVYGEAAGVAKAEADGPTVMGYARVSDIPADQFGNVIAKVRHYAQHGISAPVQALPQQQSGTQGMFG